MTVHGRRTPAFTRYKHREAGYCKPVKALFNALEVRVGKMVAGGWRS
jgi:hypothetical protein